MCGRRLCCATFLKDFEPVTLKMAKDQNLPLTPSKISGACGRLMCCLAYELDYYKELMRNEAVILSDQEGNQIEVPMEKLKDELCKVIPEEEHDEEMGEETNEDVGEDVDLVE